MTHNVAEAVYLADRVLVMTAHPGTVKTQAPIRLARPRDALSVEFLDHQKALLRLLGQELGQGKENESERQNERQREHQKEDLERNATELNR